MNLEELQDWLVTRLDDVTDTGGILEGAVVIKEDGSYPKTPAREEALSSPGLALIVWQVESEGLDEVLADGTFKHVVGIHVVVEENQAVNRGENGTDIAAEKAVRLVLERVTGGGDGATGRQAIEPMDPPFKNFGKVNGVNRWVVSFAKTFITRPAAEPESQP
jgi:hypothetical protein